MDLESITDSAIRVFLIQILAYIGIVAVVVFCIFLMAGGISEVMSVRGF